MPNHKPTSTFVSDQASLNKPRAENRDERRQALEFCLNERWANVDIGRIERVDTDEQSGWMLWRWKSDPS
jgi:hypothetical protein